MKPNRSQIKAGLLALFVALTLPVRAADIVVFAAASLTDSLKEIAATYEKQSPDKILLNLGASSTLARQIEEGAPASIFFSADDAKMDALEKKGLIVKSSRKSRLSNSLVIVVSSEDGAPVKSPRDLTAPAVKRIALGDPKAVPIGIYSRQYLEKLGLWSAIEPKVVATESVRAAMAAVESGNADASFVYKTDAAISKKVKVVFEVPTAEAPKISYPMALVQGASHPEAAQEFLDYLASRQASDVFTKFGFIVLETGKSE